MAQLTMRIYSTLMNRSGLAHRLSAAALVVGLASGCGSANKDADTSAGDSGPRFATHPERSVEGKPAYYYKSLAEQAGASDFVVRGRVVSVEPGRSAGDLPEEKIYFRDVTVEVLETVKGAVDPKMITFEEEGWDADGTGYVMNGVQWSIVGDEAWYFLAKRSDGITRLTSEYGRYTLSGEYPGPSGLEPSKDGPWHALPFDSMSKTEVRDAVLNAVGESS